MPINIEYDDGNLVVHAEARRRRVHDSETTIQNLHICDAAELLCRRIPARVRIVDAIDAFLRHKDDVRLDLGGAKRRGRVGREVRISRACRQDHDTSLFQVTHSLAANVRLGDLTHLDGTLHARIDIDVLQRALQGERVHDRREHSHVVRLCPIHALVASRKAAPDIAAADDDGDVDAVLAHLLDLGRNGVDGRQVDAEALISCERFTAEFQNDALVAGSIQNERPPCRSIFLSRCFSSLFDEAGNNPLHFSENRPAVRVS